MIRIADIFQMDPPDSSTGVSYAKDYDVQDSSLFVAATVAAQENSAIPPEQQVQNSPTNNTTPQTPSDMLGSPLPLPPAVGSLPPDPTVLIHRSFRPSAMRTAVCDGCDKKNKTIFQRCQECSMQFCEFCIRNDKVGNGHVARYEDLQ